MNFCKFTNETRNGLEDSSQHSGLKFLAAVNGACAGGGYELALACDEIVLVDDRSSAVSLPEVPLLGVLPGTGGLTRVTDKRRVRHDLADIFCTTSEGVRGQKAKDWRLVDAIAKPAVFARTVQERALELAKQSDRPADAKGVELTPLNRTIEADALRYGHVTVEIDRERRTASFVVKAPSGEQPSDLAGIEAAGADWYSLAMARARGRDPVDAHQRARHRHLADPHRGRRRRGAGDGRGAARQQGPLAGARDDRSVAAHLQPPRRVVAQPFALIEPGSCFAGTLLELALACDRSYHLALPDDADKAPKLTIADSNFGHYPMVTGQSRLQRRFYDEQPALDAVRSKAGQPLDADAAFALGLVTANPDDIDWDDEIRIAVEERVAMSPDALTGMEANLRFNGPENMFTRVSRCLTAWQNLDLPAPERGRR